jgi:ERCC4-type nuclease
MNSFGSIEKIFAASEEELAGVDGVGAVVAGTIKAKEITIPTDVRNMETQ